MTWTVRQYPGEIQDRCTEVQTLQENLNLGDAQIAVFGRAAHWWDEDKPNRKVTNPDGTTAICWEKGKIAMVLSADDAEVES